jgi:hypothetical protein
VAAGDRSQAVIFGNLNNNIAQKGLDVKKLAASVGKNLDVA